MADTEEERPSRREIFSSEKWPGLRGYSCNELKQAEETLDGCLDIDSRFSDDLHLGQNYLCDLPDLSAFTHIRKVDLSDNFLTSQNFLQELRRMSNLKRVCLANVKELPTDIGSWWPKLKTLDLSFGSLKHLPESVGNFSELEWFDCSHNELETLPESIGRLTNLKTLNCDNNLLKVLPQSIRNLSNLVDLSCGQKASEIELTEITSGLANGLGLEWPPSQVLDALSAREVVIWAQENYDSVIKSARKS